ncbi:MAG: hypothetical protein OEY52_16435 [Gammaproteobacteria bacterium]|nr:hypothetical protein [Gammaproteobacteria bacterium]
MRDLMEKGKPGLFAIILLLFIGLSACSDDSAANKSTSVAPGPLPQPSVDCGGKSCVD